MTNHFYQWKNRTETTLKDLEPGVNPKLLVSDLSEGLLKHYKGKPLVNHYDVYQHFMDYWAETMQDDCYLISADGWEAKTERIIEKNKKGKLVDKGRFCDLVPKEYIVLRYFADEKIEVDRIAARLESVKSGKTELEEEHGGEDGPFAELDKINKGNVTKLVKDLKSGAGSAEDIKVLKSWLEFSKQETALKKQLKEAEAELDTLAYEKYPELSEDEIKVLVVEDKWLDALNAAIHGEMDRVSQQLTRRVKELAERYESPLPKLADKVAEYGAKVNKHLERMGFTWQ